MAAESIKFDRAVDYYDQTRGFPEGVERDVAAVVMRAGGFTAASHTLEIGVGTGRIALPMAGQVAGVTGVDLSRPMMERLRAKQHGEPVALAEADASKLPFGPAVFDGAVAVHVFHLIPSWREVLAELARVLRPGAPLVYAGNIDGLHSMWDEMRSRGEIPTRHNVGVQDNERGTFLIEAGWTPLGDAVEATWEESFRPAIMITRVTDRLTSSTWSMSDDELATYAAALRRALTDRFGDLEHEVTRTHAFTARAFLPPRP